MSKPTPKSIYCETLFTRHITLQRRFGCKGTEKFADVQILSGKSFRSLKSLKGKSCLENGARRLLFRV